MNQLTQLINNSPYFLIGKFYHFLERKYYFIVLLWLHVFDRRQKRS